MRTITLCGLPGCGKTTVGMEIAKITSGKFIDVDSLIEDHYAKTTGERLTCRQIFSRKGGSFFRDLEKSMVVFLGENPPLNAIISIGGGAIETPENVEVFKSISLLVYLKADLKELFRRINRNGLPAYLDPKDPFASFEKLANKRTPLYEKAAHIEIDGNLLTPHDIASQIVNRVQKG